MFHTEWSNSSPFSLDTFGLEKRKVELNDENVLLKNYQWRTISTERLTVKICSFVVQLNFLILRVRENFIELNRKILLFSSSLKVDCHVRVQSAIDNRRDDVVLWQTIAAQMDLLMKANERHSSVDLKSIDNDVELICELASILDWFQTESFLHQISLHDFFRSIRLMILIKMRKFCFIVEHGVDKSLACKRIKWRQFCVISLYKLCWKSISTVHTEWICQCDSYLILMKEK